MTGRLSATAGPFVCVEAIDAAFRHALNIEGEFPLAKRRPLPDIRIPDMTRSRNPILPLDPTLSANQSDTPGDNDRDGNGDGQLVTKSKSKARPKKPSQYKVLMLNDDYTPMEFVVMVLKRFFQMDLEAATRVMLQVHQSGVGVCGVFPYEIAETKVNQVMDAARENQHPLQCTLEKA